MFYHLTSNEFLENINMNIVIPRHTLRALSLVLLLALLLVACAPAVTPAAPTSTNPPTPTATATARPTEAPKATEAMKSTDAIKATNPSSAPSGKTTYKIVPGDSKVTYEVGETFLNQNNRFNLAKGVTSQVTGQVFGDKANPTASSMGEIQIDISQFKSDSDRRDGYIRGNGLESGKYPIAKFVPTKIETLPASYTEGSEHSFKVSGDLTIKQTTKPVTWEVTTKLVGDTLTGKATTELLMSDFKVGPISILGVLNTEDKVKLTFDFVAKP
ncbi:MAG: YceI family protein [Saprospiraceae bacterium]|nr:YceI family protein [Saprospiraceae bacterium]